MPGRGDIPGGCAPGEVGALREDQLRLRRGDGRHQQARRRLRDGARRSESPARPALGGRGELVATQADEAQRDALAERRFGAALGAYELFTIHLGDRLGFYRTLVDEADVTSGELAEATETDERYAREWLEQQAVAGILEVDDVEAVADERRY